MEDHYSVLGVGRTATADEIKRAYRKLASQHHPDKGGDTATFQKIEQAYRVLSDPAARQDYDRPRNAGNQNFHDFSDIFNGVHININQHPGFEDIFSQIFGRAQPKQPERKNRDLRITLNLPLNELLAPQKKVLNYTTSKNEPTTVEIDIPAGVEDGATVRYPNLGDNFFETLPRGDLYVNIRHANTDRFAKVSPIDVATEIEIDSWDAMLGTNVQVVGLDGTVFDVKIPAGSQYGVRFNLRGQGLYQDARSGTRGSLYLILKIRTAAVPEEHRAKIQELRKSF